VGFEAMMLEPHPLTYCAQPL